MIDQFFRDFLAEQLRQAGADMPAEEGGGAGQSGSSPPGYVPDREVYRLFAALPDQIDGEPAGLVLSRRFDLDALGLPFRIASHRSTLGGAIESYLDFQHLLAQNAARLESDIGGGLAAVVIDGGDGPSAAGGREPRAVFQFALALRCYEMLLGEPNIDVAGVELMELTQAFRPAYEAHFGGSVSQRPAGNRLIFARELFDRPLAAADPEAFPYLEELGAIRSDELEEHLAGESGMIGRIRTYLQAILGRTAPTQQQAARHLGMSRRTMQRRLEEEGYDYRELLEAVRERKARDLLDHSELTNQQIAHELSYSQPSSFYRAFKRWTGQTPTEYRDD